MLVDRRLSCVLVAALLASGVVACVDDTPPTEPQSQPTLSVMPAQEVSTYWTIDDEWDRIAREEIPGFAGHYLDENQNSVIYLVDPAQRGAAERYIAEHREKKGLAPQPMIMRQANFDYTQLKQWHDQLVPLLASDDRRMTLLDIDEVNNRVSVGVEDAGAVETLRADAAAVGIPRAAVRVDVVPRAESRLTLQEYYRPVQPGFQIQNIRGGPSTCTLGFNAKRDGERVFVTASHCSYVPFQLDYSLEYQEEVSGPKEIGHETEDREFYRCSFFFFCRWSDASVYTYNADVDDDFGYIANTRYYGIGERGSLEINPKKPRWEITAKRNDALVEVGDWVHKVGRTSGWTRGPIILTCVWRQGPDGMLRCQYEAELWAEHGDSGSPVFMGTKAAALHGVLWGGRNYDTTLYSPISGIERDLGGWFTVCEGNPLNRCY